MEPIITTLFVLLFAQSITNVPVVEWKSNQCSSRCQSDPQFVRFDSQKTYEYRLQTKTSFDGQQEVALEAKVELSAHSPCDLSLQLRQTRLQGVDPQEALLLQQQLEEQPIQFGYDDGIITDVCAEQEDHLWAIDVKKAVISALQMSSRSLNERQTLMESDILGDCETTYQPMSRRYATAVLRKTKSLNKCANRQLANIGLFPRAFSSSSYQSIPLMNATFECLQTVDKDLIIGATCQESQQLRGYATQVLSQLNLRFDGQTSGLSTRRVRQMLENNRHLLMSSRFDSRQDSKQDLTSILRTICQHLESDSNERTVESFPQLVRALTQDSQQIQRNWKSVQNQEICSSKQLSDLFLDASALSGSQSGAQVLLDAYQTGIVSKERSNYLFSLLAFTSSPNEKAVQTLQPLLKSVDTPKHVILGISGLIHNLKHSNQREGQSVRAIDALLERMSHQKKDSSIVATIKAIENIGVESHEKARRELMKVSQDSRQSTGVRVAAIKALSEAMDSKQRQEMIEIFRKENESNEIRIKAYKAVVMSGADKQQLQQIKDQIRREQNRDVQQYVRSHQKNLRESSDPHKKYVLPQNAPQFEEPSNQWMGISNNFESSYMFDALSLGVALEADVINPKESSIPRSLTANITIPAFGKELQLIEFEIRQKGFESQIQQKMRQLKNKSGQSLVKQMMAEAIDIISSSSEWTSNSADSRDLQMQVHVKVDGKTILSVDSSDAKQDWEQMWNQLRHKLDQRLDIDRAFAVQPINTRIQLPTTNGLPIVVRLNATLVSSLKSSIKVSDLQRNSNSKQFEAMISPSFALQMEAGVEFMTKNQRKAIEVVSRVTSSPVWDSKTEIRENRILNVKINLPKERQSLVKMETQVYSRDESGIRVQKSSSYRSNNAHKECTQSLKKAFGLQLCSEMTSQPLAYELSLEKSDRNMKSFEFSIESPQKTDSSSSSTQNYRIAFNTPNSEVDREMSGQLSIDNHQSGRKNAKIEIRSPWIRYSVEAGLVNEDKEQSIQLQVQRDGRKTVSVDLGLESQQRGQKREYRPRVRIQMQESEPIQMQGSVSVSKGRKNQLQIQLEGNQKQFLKGSFVREGERKSNDIRVSTDLSANFPQIELRVVGVAEKGVKHAETDLTIEYRIRQQRKESLKVSFKVQNLTQSQLTKVSAFGELTSTQWPFANFHLAYNLLAKPQQQMENELTLAWTQQLSSKIHILHVTKLSEQSSNERKLENTLNVEITPLNVNYELRANADIQRENSGSNSGPKYTAEVIGKDRTGRKENDMKASFVYKHVSQSPLHLTLEANLKTQKRDLQYRDELRERSEGEYQGQTSFQWQKGQKADLDYNYKIKGQLHHEMDAQFKIGDKHVIKHSGMLKMSPKEFQLKSKLSQNENQIYNLDSYLSRESPSQVEVHSFGYAVKARAQPYSVPQLASVELWTPNARINALHHKTNVEFIPRVSFALKSDTKRNSRNVLDLETHISRTEPSRIVVNSEPVEGRLDLDLLSSSGRSANLALKCQPQDWSHSSSLAFEPKESFEFKSKTVSKGKPVFQVDSNWKPRQQSFLNIEVPQQKTTLALNGVLSGRQKSGQLELLLNDLKHKTDFELNSNQMRIQSKTDSNRRQIHSLNYNHNNGLHSLDSELFQDYKISGEAQRFGEEPYLRFNGHKKSSQLETEAKISRQANKISFESKTKQFGNPLNQMSAQLYSSPQKESQLSFISPKITTKFITIPAKRAQLEWECPQVSHVTKGQWNGDSEEDNYSLDSKTLFKNRNQFLNLAVKHSPLRLSRFSAQIPIGDAEFEVTNQQKARLAVNSKHPNYPYSHVTEVSSNPNQWNLESRTDSQSENVFSVNSKIQRNLSNPSTFEMRVGKDFVGKARALPFRQLVVEAKHPKLFSHSSALDLDGNSLQLKSRTDSSSGRALAKIDAFLTPSQELRSHVTFVAHNSNGNFEFEPKKSAKFELNANQYNHKTEISRNVNNNEIRIQSKTTRGGANVLDLNSRLNDWQKSSHLNFNSPIIESQFQTIPSQKSAKITFKTQTVNHESEVNGPQRSFNSRTERNGRLWARINGKLEDNNQLEVEIPSFLAKSHLNFGQRSAQMDFRSKIPSGRHLLASVAFNDGFHSDIAWDLEKDPNQRLVLDLNVKRDGNSWNKKQLIYSLSASYAGNDVKVVSRMTTNEVIRGPHELEVHYLPKFNPKRDSIDLNFKHEINSQNQMICRLDYLEGERHKFGAKFNGEIGEEGVSSTLETTAPNNPDLEMKVTFNERHSQREDISFELKALKTTLNEEYSLSAKINRNNGWKGSARLETPKNGPQDLEFVLENNSLRVWSENSSGKQLEVNGKYLIENNGFSANFDLKSNLRGIPSLSVNSVLKKNEEILLTLDFESQRKVDFLLRKSGNSYSSGIQINGRLETTVFPKIETKNSLKYDSREIQFSSNVKYDQKDISSVELEAKKENGIWAGNGRIAANGAELAKASIESTFGSNTMSYILNAKTRDWSPIKVHFSSERISSSERKIQLNACKQRTQECVDIKTQWKRNTNQWIPEKSFFSLSKIGTNIEIKTSFMEQMETNSDSSSTSLLGVTTNERVNQKTRNQFQISVNSHQMGFDEITQYRSHGYDASIRVQYPSKEFQIKTDFADRKSSSSERDVISKTQLFFDQKSNPLIESEIHLQSNEKRVSVNIQLSSEKFQRSPKVIQMTVQRPTKDNQKPFSGKLFFDLSSNPNEALSLESEVTQRSMNSQWNSREKNSTFSLNVFTKDKKSIDFQMSAHLSPISGGIHYENRNRRGQQKRGSLFVKRENQNRNEEIKRFNIELKDENNDYSIDASFGPQIQLKVRDERSGQQSDVTLGMQNKCLTLEVRKEENQRKRFDFCLNFENRNDKTVSLSLESDSEKTAEFTLEVDSRDKKAIKATLEWNPRELEEWKRSQRSYSSSYSSSDYWNELWEELSAKSEVVAKQLQSEAVIPVIDQMNDVIQEIYSQFKSLQFVQRLVDSMTSSMNESFDWLQTIGQKVMRSARKQCKRSEMCFKTIYALENYGFDSAGDLFFESLKRTHRLVVTSSGRLFASLPSLPDWMQTIVEDYRQSLYSTFNSIIDSNNDLREVSNHFSVIFEEMKRNSEEMDWNRIKEAMNQIKQILFSSQTSSRVVVWDPLRGKASLEIRSPAIQSRRLRAVLQNVTEEIQKKDSIKSMFY